MKKFITFFMIATAAMLIGACSEFPFAEEELDQALKSESSLKTVPSDPCSDETAWTQGIRYPVKGGWGMFTPLQMGVQIPIIAGQHMEAGFVEFKEMDDGKIKIKIFLGWCFQDVSEPLKIQGYDVAPDERPKPGLFDTFKGYPAGKDGYYMVIVDKFAFYGIHFDLGCCK